MDPFRCPHQTDKLLEVSVDFLKTALKGLYKLFTLSLDFFPNSFDIVLDRLIPRQGPLPSMGEFVEGFQQFHNLGTLV